MTWLTRLAEVATKKPITFASLAPELLDLVRAAEAMKYREQFDCTIVEANDWQRFQDARIALRAAIDKELGGS